MIPHLGALLGAPDPHIILNDGERKNIRHHAEAPASEAALQQLAGKLHGSCPELLALYRRHNGLYLFAQPDDDEASLQFLPVEHMDGGKEDLADWLEIDALEMEDVLDEEETSDGRLMYYGFPDWWDNAVVFAYFGYSPECLLMPTQGEHAGKIFIYEHDGGDATSQVADNLADLFRRLAAEDPAFLRGYYGVEWYEAARYCSG